MDAAPVAVTEFNEFQKAFISYAMGVKRCLCRAQPGAGKSIAITGLYGLLRRRDPSIGPILIISASKYLSAFQKANFQKLTILKIVKEPDMAYFYEGHDFPAQGYFLSESMMSRVVLKGTYPQKKALTQLLNRVSLLVFDEAHALSKPFTQRTRAFRKIADYYNKLIEREPLRRKLILVTATPMYRTLEDWHPIFSALCPVNPLGSYQSFMDTYCVVEERQSWGSHKVFTSTGSRSVKGKTTFTQVTGYKNVDQLYRTIAPYIFNWEKSDFTVKFALHYFGISPEERREYAAARSGAGLDRAYSVCFSYGGHDEWQYLEKSDTVILADGHSCRADSLQPGLSARFQGGLALIRDVRSREADATFAVRAIKCQQVTAKFKDKLFRLKSLVESARGGCLVYFNFIDSVDIARQSLNQALPHRRVVVLTGQTPNFQSLVQSIGPEDIVLISSVGSQSLDFAYSKLIIYEPWALGPGRMEQLVGRLTRFSSQYRDLTVDILLSDTSVETYFYERARLLIKTSRTNVYTKGLPPSRRMEGVPEAVVDMDYLKRHFLWAKG